MITALRNAVIGRYQGARNADINPSHLGEGVPEQASVAFFHAVFICSQRRRTPKKHHHFLGLIELLFKQNGQVLQEHIGRMSKAIQGKGSQNCEIS